MALNQQFSVEDQIRNKAKELGFNLIDHRLELYGKQIKKK